MVKTEDRYPVVPLREVVLFPDTLYPLLIARPFSLKAARHAISMNRSVVFVTQRDSQVELPQTGDIYTIGTIGKFLQYVTPPDGSIRTVVQGIKRVKIAKLTYTKEEYFIADVKPLPQISFDTEEETQLARMAKEYLQEYLEANKTIPEEVSLAILDTRTGAQHLANLLSAHFPMETKMKQELLEAGTLKEQLEGLVRILIKEKEFIRIRRKIESRVQDEIKKSQKQFFLQQEMREIQKELGEDSEDEFGKLEEDIKSSLMPEGVKEKALDEVRKLRRTPPISPESTVIRNYLDWLLSLPWGKLTKDNLDIKNAKRILDRDHYGLKEPKSRILEYLSVLKLKGEVKGQVLCFVGPPGSGKTSLAMSIAKALGRSFVRMSLGGLRDEAEIRGHRRTYVGAQPGRIIQQIKRAGSKNPVFLLDEVDKIGMDFRGDPQAALMEVLDPEVNTNFQDNYLEVDFDLSRIFFITTANSTHGIPRPLLDRMEIIYMRGYLDFEKLEIAKRHLVPKKLKEMGFPRGKIKFDDGAILKLIREYTREAGVRELERLIVRILRKSAKKIVEKKCSIKISADSLERYLGIPMYRVKETHPVLPAGVVYGLAWTEYGGDILRVEVSVMSGKGEMELTGSLGDIMKESAKTALSNIRTNIRLIGLPSDFYKNVDLHLHVPEGAIPKDGPSAGIAIWTAMVSALTKTEISGEIGMTGEITLSGEILRVGGLEDKLLAAKRSGIKTVYIPYPNEPDITKMKKEITEGLHIIYLKNITELISNLFPKNFRDTIPQKPSEDYARWIST